jgi:hypothetical protein
MSTRISSQLPKLGLMDGINRVRVLDLSFDENAVLCATYMWEVQWQRGKQRGEGLCLRNVKRVSQAHVGL